LLRLSEIAAESDGLAIEMRTVDEREPVRKPLPHPLPLLNAVDVEPA